MEPKELKKRLKKKKKRLLKNVITLRDTLDSCVEAGLLDIDSTYYNQLESLEEEIQTSEDLNALEELVIRGQSFEKQLCGFYDNLGLSTTDLDWPSFEND